MENVQVESGAMVDAADAVIGTVGDASDVSAQA